MSYPQPLNRWWHAVWDALLGPHCPTCWERVFPRDRNAHSYWCD